MKMNILTVAIATILSVPAGSVSAGTTTYDWAGQFVLLDPTGKPLSNTSVTKGVNPFYTDITGIIEFDTATGAGVGVINDFDLLAGSLPTNMQMNLQSIGDGVGGPGSLVVGNMLFNWNGNNGSPVSMVMDAAGFFGATAGMWVDGTLDQAEVSGFGAVPASDGTYTSPPWGYLGLGAVPIATLEYDTTNNVICTYAADTDYSNNAGGGCMGVATSGTLPLVVDTAANGSEYAMGDGVGIGGSPMQDGPFQGYNMNIDILSLTYNSEDPGGSVPANCVVDNNVGSVSVCYPLSPVPVPAAVWLFGSGLLGLVGLSRRRRE